MTDKDDYRPSIEDAYKFKHGTTKERDQRLFPWAIAFLILSFAAPFLIALWPF